jgi:hypothetical protein
MLVSQFEGLKMHGDDTFNEFYTKIKDLRNFMVSLRKNISDAKLIKKIIRFLSERFIIKVTTIEESKDLDAMKIEELVGFLQTYEFSLPPIKKVKSITLKAAKGKSKVSSNEDDGLAMLECSGYGHIQTDSGNLKQAKGKTLNTTLSNDSEEEETPVREQKFMAFITLHTNPKESQSYYFESSDEENLKDAYKVLHIKFMKLRETHQQNVLELNSMKTEKSTLLHKITDLEDKLLEAQLQLERITNEKLTQMLSGQKYSSNKTGLEYVASSSK